MAAQRLKKQSLHGLQVLRMAGFISEL